MPYVVLVVSALMFDLALNLPVGTMPLALVGDGTPVTAVAIAMGSGMFAALVVSLPIGALVDRFGRLPILRAAGVLGVFSLFGLAFVHGPILGGLFLGIRSVAIVAYVTAEFAYAGELASADRAVSGVSTLGMIGNLTFAIAPALSVFLWQHGVHREQYAWASILAIGGAACLWLLPAKYDVRASGAKRRTIVMHPRWLPTVAFTIASTLQGGVNGSLAILTFHERGIVNGAAIFTAMAFSAFALRYPAGRLVDRFGPRAIAVPTAVIQALGCVLAASAHSLAAVVIAGMCLGLAWSAVVPVALGLLFEHSSSRTRGAAMGAYNLAFSVGAAGGAALATVATLLGPGYGLAMAMCAVGPLAVLPYVMRSRAGSPVAFVRSGAAASGD
ncbi:MAG: MFS transporter [Candidatus Eremiobacteraeota bacterium]|nr:MFS transporter [Candidatus Eremiobacteraeota bacterium]